MEKSKCCGAKVKVIMSGDFIGDNPNTMEIGTCHYVCTECKEACDIKSKQKQLEFEFPELGDLGKPSERDAI